MLQNSKQLGIAKDLSALRLRLQDSAMRSIFGLKSYNELLVQ